jgi:hypothetical protein
MDWLLRLTGNTSPLNTRANVASIDPSARVSLVGGVKELHIPTEVLSGIGSPRNTTPLHDDELHSFPSVALSRITPVAGADVIHSWDLAAGGVAAHASHTRLRLATHSVTFVHDERVWLSDQHPLGGQSKMEPSP